VNISCKLSVTSCKIVIIFLKASLDVGDLTNSNTYSVDLIYTFVTKLSLLSLEGRIGNYISLSSVVNDSILFRKRVIRLRCM